jgi:predicted phage replisome organizer
MMDMRERKYLKLRSDMYEDTKFKIIDMKAERDMIHYVWTRFLTLAAKVNLAGDLFMSRNLPYTVETLAIEFNRSKEQIKLAIDLFLELEMIELIDGRIYRVKNFAKHQNIKVEEKAKSEDKEVKVKNIEAALEAVITNEVCDEEEKKSDRKDEEKDKDQESQNSTAKNDGVTIINEDKMEVEINNNRINKENNMSSEISNNISQHNITIPFEKKKNKKSKEKKEEVINVTDEEVEDGEIFCFREGEYIPGEGEKIIASWKF